MSRPGRKVGYSLRAATAVRDQAAWYEARRPGLGLEFFDTIAATARLIQSNPEGFPRLAESPDIRSVVVRRFPFRLLYALRGDSILILRVAHTARQPERLLDR